MLGEHVKTRQLAAGASDIFLTQPDGLQRFFFILLLSLWIPFLKFPRTLLHVYLRLESIIDSALNALLGPNSILGLLLLSGSLPSALVHSSLSTTRCNITPF